MDNKAPLNNAPFSPHLRNVENRSSYLDPNIGPECRFMTQFNAISAISDVVSCLLVVILLFASCYENGGHFWVNYRSKHQRHTQINGGEIVEMLQLLSVVGFFFFFWIPH